MSENKYPEHKKYVDKFKKIAESYAPDIEKLNNNKLVSQIKNKGISLNEEPREETNTNKETSNIQESTICIGNNMNNAPTSGEEEKNYSWLVENNGNG